MGAQVNLIYLGKTDNPIADELSSAGIYNYLVTYSVLYCNKKWKLPGQKFSPAKFILTLSLKLPRWFYLFDTRKHSTIYYSYLNFLLPKLQTLLIIIIEEYIEKIPIQSHFLQHLNDKRHPKSIMADNSNHDELISQFCEVTHVSAQEVSSYSYIPILSLTIDR